MDNPEATIVLCFLETDVTDFQSFLDALIYVMVHFVDYRKYANLHLLSNYCVTGGEVVGPMGYFVG